MQIENLQKIIDQHFEKINNPKVLEAGCGSMSKIELLKDRFLSGIDISRKQLDRNPILDEKILGDIQTYDLGNNKYDLIVCWHVLEHLDKPKSTMNNFLKGVKNDGLIIIASPNPLSIKGLITKFTPHWFHIFVYKYFYGRKDAGENDTAPFPTKLKFFINPKRLIKFGNENGLVCVNQFYNDALNGWVGKSIQDKSKVLFTILKTLKTFSTILTFNLVSESEFILVFKKTKVMIPK